VYMCREGYSFGVMSFLTTQARFGGVLRQIRSLKILVVGQQSKVQKIIGGFNYDDKKGKTEVE